MKKLAQLFKKIAKVLRHTSNPAAVGTRKTPQAAELEKAWYTYLNDKESKILDSDQQWILLYQFMLSHRENDLN